MPDVKITVRDKVAIGDRSRIVCGNSDYAVRFDFDAEWDGYDAKTARFVLASQEGKYLDVVFTGDVCQVPVLQDTIGVYVGVYAGDLHTTTPAWFDCDRSILCGGGSPAAPPDDVYAQVMAILKDIEIIDRKTLDAAVASALAAEKKCEAAAVNLPVLSDAGTWKVWDFDKSEYVDTGVNARSAAPDWNQNDESADDFVKNRTHWLEGPLEKEIYPKTVVDFTGEPAEISIPRSHDFWTDLNSASYDGELSVEWDGIRYSTSIADLDNTGFMGNPAFNEEGADNGVPFLMWFSDEGLMFATASLEGEHYFSIYLRSYVVHPLDAKYLPTDYAFFQVTARDVETDKEYAVNFIQVKTKNERTSKATYEVIYNEDYHRLELCDAPMPFGGYIYLYRPDVSLPSSIGASVTTTITTERDLEILDKLGTNDRSISVGLTLKNSIRIGAIISDATYAGLCYGKDDRVYVIKVGSYGSENGVVTIKRIM